MTEAARLIARSRRLDRDPDLVGMVAGPDAVLFQRGGHGFAGQGVACRVEVPRSSPDAAAKAVHDALGAIEVDDEVGLAGCGPVGLGALPFDAERVGELLVPEVLVGRADDGTRWVTTVTADVGEEPLERLARAEEAAGATDDPTGTTTDDVAFTIRSTRPPAEWCASLVSARDELRAGRAQKVVLAREITIETTRALGAQEILRRLHLAYPGCMLYAVGGFLGATPELLVARQGDIVRSHPMAGTAPRSADPTADARLAATLLASTKDREEHRITIDMVHDTLLPWCSYLDEEAEPSIVTMANVQHLATMVEGRLSSPPASVVELVTALHPTPAVCGYPRGDALDLIDAHEDLDRGRYAGPVGWVDAAGNGEWAVGIRSAQLDGRVAHLVAGVGVLPDSDPDAELAETRAKLQALLNAIVRV